MAYTRDSVRDSTIPASFAGERPSSNSRSPISPRTNGGRLGRNWLKDNVLDGDYGEESSSQNDEFAYAPKVQAFDAEVPRRQNATDLGNSRRLVIAIDYGTTFTGSSSIK